MTLEEARRLIHSEVAPLRERAIKADARDEAMRVLEAVQFPDWAKQEVVARCIEGEIPTDGKELDATKFRETVVNETKRMGRILREASGAGEVFGMGGGAVETVDPKEAERLREAAKLRESEDVNVFAELMGNDAAAKIAARGRIN